MKSIISLQGPGYSVTLEGADLLNEQAVRFSAAGVVPRSDVEIIKDALRLWLDETAPKPKVYCTGCSVLLTGTVVSPAMCHPCATQKTADIGRCQILSSVTGLRCDLPDGHPCHSATRFHRFPTPVPQR